jgi:signal transduction histidine kinase
VESGWSSAPPATRDSSAHTSKSRDRGVVLWTVIIPWIGFLVWQVIAHSEEVLSDSWTLVGWLALLTVVSFMPVFGWRSAPLIPDVPVIIALSILLPPVEAGLVGFLGESDSREFRGRISLRKALFNRSQLAINTYAASALVHLVAPSSVTFPHLVILGLITLVVNTSLNYLMVGSAIALDTGHRIREVIGRLRLGTWSDFLLTNVAWMVFACMLVALYSQIHAWALVAFAAPILLGRHVLVRSQMLLDVSRAYRSRGEAIRELSSRIQEERRDERHLIAADLHDEVLQPLYNVTLMAQVLRVDLESGRLLDLEADLPELVVAADSAASQLRGLISELHRSALGRAGLPTSLQRLARDLSDRTSMRLHVELDDIDLSELQELALYQIAKEAMTNAAHHAAATDLWLILQSNEGVVVLEIRDNGRGFDSSADRAGHFGLQIMQERAAAADAQLYVDSMPNQGCCVRVVLGTKPR